MHSTMINGFSRNGQVTQDEGQQPSNNNLSCMSQILNSYLEGQWDLVSRLIRGITEIIMWVIGVIKLLTKSPLTLQVVSPLLTHVMVPYITPFITPLRGLDHSSHTPNTIFLQGTLQLELL